MAMMAHPATIKFSFAVERKKRRHQAYLSCRIARGAMTICLMLQEAVVFSGRVQHKLTIARQEDATIKHFICC
jgi:hypothetical protein